MAFSQIKVEVVVSDDQNENDPTFGPRHALVQQINDLNVASIGRHVNPADAEALVSIAPVTQGYRIAVFADYPVLVRLNGPTATQFQLTPNQVTPTSLGAPIPDQAVLVMTALVTSVYIAPVANASRTANVHIVVTGDPSNAYGPG